MEQFKHTLIALLFCVTSLGANASITPLDALPPVPARILENIAEAGHPFLLGNREWFRETEDQFQDYLFDDLYDHFQQRVKGYVQKESPWYLGEGPFSTNEDFHPRYLEGEDALLYHQAVCEMMMYLGMEPERWAINRLKREFLRQLNELKRESTVGFYTFSEESFTLPDVRLLASATLVYDMAYYRFETIERHDLNRQLKQIRDRLANFCSSINPSAVTPSERVAYGTALGLSTLMCISVYHNEWEDHPRYSVQSFLPDLYRAISFTRSGMENLVTDGHRLQVTMDELQETLLLGIPWIESVKRLGYPMILSRGTYGQLFKAINLHRLPGTLNTVMPSLTSQLSDPWIPKTSPLFWEESSEMYEKKNTENEALNTLDREVKVSGSEEEPIGVPESLPKTERKKFNTGGQPITLRKMLEEFGHPRRKPAQPTPTPAPKPQETLAGWKKPKGLLLPPVWGSLCMLASIDQPSCRAQDFWEAQASEIDSHPYTYHFYRIVESGFRQQHETATLLQYPSKAFSVLSFESYRDPFLFAQQSAKGTVASPTYTMNHESFLLNEGGTQWRWLHEAESAAEEKSSSLPSYDSFQEEVLKTSLFTTWSTYSPHGRTQVLRRHGSAIGGAYTVVAHFPDDASNESHIRNIVFKLPGEAEGKMNQEVSEMLRIIPQAALEYSGPMSVHEWQQVRRAERAGFIAPKHVGMLNVLFSPESIKQSGWQDGTIGSIYDVELKNPDKPFFYIVTLDQPGRPMFETKFDSLPVGHVRLVEWNGGIDLVAISDGEEYENPFIHTDAELAMVIRDRSMSGLFYIMVNGTFMRVKLSPTQEEYVLLADTKGKRVTAAWSNRKIYTNRPPNAESRFYAPKISGFECPGTVIDYGQKGRQAMVWGHEPEKRHASLR